MTPIEVQRRAEHPNMMTTPRPFDNCAILAPDGAVLGRCRLPLARWYLNRGLADEVAPEPLTVRLRFEPAGRVGQNSPALLEPKLNRCAQCGVDARLTRHHVVPRCYRRWFPPALKLHCAYDVVALCVPHHVGYEKHADALKRALAAECDLIDPDRLGAALAYARTLRSRWESIPEERRDVMLRRVAQTLRLPQVTRADLPGVGDETYWRAGREVVHRLGPEAVSRRWRLHFLAAVQPKHMPSWWKPC